MYCRDYEKYVLSFFKTTLMARKIINIRNWFFLKSCGEQHNWKLVTQTMGVSRLQLSRSWKFLEAESFSRLQLSHSWKFLRAESFSYPLGWKFLEAESFSGLKVSQGWKFLRAENVFQPPGWKFLKAEIVSAESVSRLKMSFGVRTASFLQLKVS